MYLLGYDIGSSSVKAALVHLVTGETSVVQSPETEMEVQALKPGWAEQQPQVWWQHVCLSTKKLLQKTGAHPAEIRGIGIAYQMHGLVLVDENQQVLRPSIIWCDSRAVEIGNRAFDEIGHETCLSHLLNSPGNFTAAKLAWVLQNEPEVFEKTAKFMLPGDYIAMRLTGEVLTTPSGLSEGIFWDFKKNEIAELVLDHFGFDKKLIPQVTSTFSFQGKLTAAAAKDTGLVAGIPITYRAGDQPNNALSLNVLQPGEVAATGGTSGVVYAVLGQPAYDPQSRVSGFLHVNHGLPLPTGPATRIGILLCINGAGSQYAWTRRNTAGGFPSYAEMEKLAAAVPIGSAGLRILPFGNGAERMLGNREIGAEICNLHFNRHGQAQLCRAALEGVAFAFIYGMRILTEMGLDLQVLRVGNDNLFQSTIFSETIANLADCRIEMLETTGAIGAARAAGLATGVFDSPAAAMSGNSVVKVFEPTTGSATMYEAAYRVWEDELMKRLAPFI